tara:strand:+ start:729 stop:920 length:192 start_codon:yes stop_codon:yes gene_type:complete
MLSKKILTNNCCDYNKSHDSDICYGWLPVTQQKLGVEANSNKTDYVFYLVKAGHTYHHGAWFW